MSTYTPPEFFQYPPYFTLQEVESTRTIQEILWTGHILAYCRAHGIRRITLDAKVLATPLFSNAAISRSLNLAAATHLCDRLVAAGGGHWADDSRTTLAVYEHSLGEWADVVWQWAVENYKMGEVVTLFALQEEDAAFKGLESDVFFKVVETLESRGKGAAMRVGGEIKGVKFAQL